MKTERPIADEMKEALLAGSGPGRVAILEESKEDYNTVVHRMVSELAENVYRRYGFRIEAVSIKWDRSASNKGPKFVLAETTVASSILVGDKPSGWRQTQANLRELAKE